MGLLIAYAVIIAVALVGAFLVHSNSGKTSLGDDLLTAGMVYSSEPLSLSGS